MFDGLLINDKSKIQLTALVNGSPHGIALVGPDGSGKLTLAKHIVANILELNNTDSLENYPYFTLLDPAALVITIDEIRALQKLLTLRTPENGKKIRRAIIIRDAGRMRQEAQNAFLKSLEEPPADTVLVLTSEGGNDLLPTIYSRVQRVEIQPVDENSAVEFYKKSGISTEQIVRNYALSKGQPGLLHSLLNSDEHELKNWVEKAKELIKIPAGERLLQVDQLSKDKLDAKQLIGAIKRIAHAALYAAGKANNKNAVTKWQSALSLAQNAEIAIQKNANTKLVLDELLLNL